MVGGVLFMLMGGRPSGSLTQISDPDSRLKNTLTNLMDLSWRDLIDKDLIEEEKRDGFNILWFLRTTEEIVASNRCGGFKIVKMQNLKIADHMNGKYEELMKDHDFYSRSRANYAHADLKTIVLDYLGPDLTRKLFEQYTIQAAADKDILNKNCFYHMIVVSAIKV